MEDICKQGDIELRVINESDISQELDGAIRDGLIESFEPDRDYFSRYSWWHSRPDWRVLGWREDGVVVGHIAIVEREILVGTDCKAVKAAGIQSVFVREDWRGKSFSDLMMAQTMKESQSRGLDAGLLFCMPKLEKVYGRMGWVGIDAKVFMRNEQGESESIPGRSITMVYCFGDFVMPGGDIDLAGEDW